MSAQVNMQAILTNIQLKEPEAALDLKELLENTDVEILSKCVGEDGENILIHADEFFLKLGYGGDEADQRRSAKRCIKSSNIPTMVIPAKDVLNENVIDGKHVLNPVTNVSRTQKELAHLMSPLNLLLLFTNAATPKATSMKRALWTFFITCRSHIESAIHDQLNSRVCKLC